MVTQDRFGPLTDGDRLRHHPTGWEGRGIVARASKARARLDPRARPALRYGGRARLSMSGALRRLRLSSRAQRRADLGTGARARARLRVRGDDAASRLSPTDDPVGGGERDPAEGAYAL